MRRQRFSLHEPPSTRRLPEIPASNLLTALLALRQPTAPVVASARGERKREHANVEGAAPGKRGDAPRSAVGQTQIIPLLRVSRACFAHEKECS